MASNPMQPMGGQDSGSELEDLEARVSAIEAKLGMNSPADEAEPTAPMMTKKPGGPKPFFGGSY